MGHTELSLSETVSGSQACFEIRGITFKVERTAAED
jgi:hypothetical protein